MSQVENFVSNGWPTDSLDFNKEYPNQHRSEPITSVVIHPRKIYYSCENSIFVWDVQTNQIGNIFRGYHKEEIRQIVADVDSYVYSVSEDKSIAIWKEGNSQPINFLTGHKGWVNCIAVDSTRIYTASYDTTIKIWDKAAALDGQENLSPITTIEGHTESINALQIDDSRIYTGSADHTVRIWEKSSGKLLFNLWKHRDTVYDIAVNDNYILSCSADKTIQIWNKQTGEHVSQLIVPVDPYKLLVRNTSVICGTYNGSIFAFDISDVKKPRKIEFVQSGLNGFAPLCNSRITAIALDDTSLYVSSEKGLELRSFHFKGLDNAIEESFQLKRKPVKVIHSIAEIGKDITCITVASDRIIAGLSSGDIHAYDRRTLRLVNEWKGHNGPITSLVSDASHLFSGSSDHTIRVWGFHAAESERVIEFHTGTITSLHIDDVNDKLYSSSEDTTIKVWDKSSIDSNKAISLIEHKGPILCLANDSLFLYSGSSDKTIKVWSKMTGKLIRTLQTEGEVSCIAVTDKDIVSSYDDVVQVWDKSGSHVIREWKLNSKITKIHSHLGSIYVGTQDGSIILWDIKNQFNLSPVILEVNSNIAHTSVCALTVDHEGIIYTSYEKNFKINLVISPEAMESHATEISKRIAELNKTSANSGISSLNYSQELNVPSKDNSETLLKRATKTAASNPQQTFAEYRPPSTESPSLLRKDSAAILHAREPRLKRQESMRGIKPHKPTATGYLEDESEEIISPLWSVESPQTATEFIFVPVHLERMILWGMFVCLDSFLFVLTLLPIRFFLALKELLKGTKRLAYVQKIDLLRVVLIMLAFSVVCHFDNAEWGNFVKRSSLKLKMVWMCMEFMDKLLVAYGERTLGSLFWAVSVPNQNVPRGRWFYFLVSWGYMIVHSGFLLVHISVINVAVHEGNKSLLALLLLVQFSEMKGAALKKTSIVKLYQECQDDIVERFQLIVFLMYVFLYNTLRGEFKLDTYELSIYSIITFFQAYEDIFLSVIYVYLSELCVDWIKHASIANFNNILPQFYTQSASTIAYELSISPYSSWLTDKSFAVSKKIGLFSLPLTVVVLKLMYDWVSYQGFFLMIDVPRLIILYGFLFIAKFCSNYVLDFYIQQHKSVPPLNFDETSEKKKKD